VDLLIASRRIDTAICTFGGSLIFRKPQTNGSTSIFRKKEEEYPKQRYEQSLHQRYHLTEGRISWDVEENPPVESTGSIGTNILDKRENGGQSKDGKGSLHVIAEDENGGKQTESNASTDAQKMKYR
jgi:hypothetical protein